MNKPKTTWLPDSKFVPIDLQTDKGIPKTDVEHPIDALFEIFFDEEVMGQVLLNHSASGGKVEKEELKAFLVSLLLMWAQPQPEVADYWLDPHHNLTGSLWMPLIVSNKNKWYRVSKAIRCKEHCKEVVELINKKIKENYQPGRILAIDEWLAFFSGADNAAEVCIKVKPAGVGFKFYVICDQNGVAYHTVLYMKEKMAVYDLTLDLVHRLPKEEGVIYTVVMDSFYSSLDLALQLHNEGFGFAMVLRKNGDQSPYFGAMADAVLKKGDWAACTIPNKEGDPHQHNILAVLFHDKKQIFFLTNVQTAEPHKKQYRVVPEVAHFYNRNMLWVDQFDATVSRKNHKVYEWSQCVIIYLFRGAVSNAWRYWRLLKNSDVSLRKFIESIIFEYLKRKETKIESPHKILATDTTVRCQVCNKSNTNLKCAKCRVYAHRDCWHQHTSVVMMERSSRIEKDLFQKKRREK